jgi:hypothetical protein
VREGGCCRRLILTDWGLGWLNGWLYVPGRLIGDSRGRSRLRFGRLSRGGLLRLAGTGSDGAVPSGRGRLPPLLVPSGAATWDE